MKIGIPREVATGESRVALIPSDAALLVRQKHELLVEAGAGIRASFSDAEYQKSGARLVPDREALYRDAEVIFKVNPPLVDQATGDREADLINEGAAYLGFLAPLSNPATITTFARRRVLSFSMEYIPRITRAQSMDALSSMGTIAGYKAVLVAAEKLGKMFPLLMTAAGTVAPATVLVLGAGVAGLQAIATARRLGAKVEAFDPRPAVKEQVKSLGAAFIEMPLAEDSETEGGYARQQSEAFLLREREVIAARLARVDVIISAAQVFGRRAPLLVTAEMAALLRPGSVIVDLAAEQGGNCELTEEGRVVEKNGILVVGVRNLATTVPVHASQMYSKNVVNLFQHLFKNGSGSLNMEDEIARGACITRDGEIVNEQVRQALQRGD